MTNGDMPSAAICSVHFDLFPGHLPPLCPVSDSDAEELPSRGVPNRLGSDPGDSDDEVELVGECMLRPLWCTMGLMLDDGEDPFVWPRAFTPPKPFTGLR